MVDWGLVMDFGARDTCRTLLPRKGRAPLCLMVIHPHAYRPLGSIPVVDSNGDGLKALLLGDSVQGLDLPGGRWACWPCGPAGELVLCRDAQAGLA